MSLAEISMVLHSIKARGSNGSEERKKGVEVGEQQVKDCGRAPV